jgi:L-alanine-DL-glutamate epimerase-like enolase superfamily enzyme
VIARGSRSEAKVVVVEMEEDGVKGVGECTPYPRYGESIASVMAQMMAIGEQLESGSPANSCSICCRQPRATPLTARCGICRRGAKAKPSQLLGSAAQPGGHRANGGHWHAGSDGGQRRGAVGEGGQLLKVKLDDDDQRAVDRHSQGGAEATLIVDANESWPAMAWRRAVSCWRTSAWRCWSSRFRRTPMRAGKFYSSAAICADESCHTRESLRAARAL